MDAQNQSHYKKAGRSGGVPTKGGGGASSYAPTNPANRSFKYNNYAPVPQPGGGTGNVDSGNSSAVQNVAHQQLPTRRIPEAAAVSKTSYNLKPTDASTLMTTRPVPKSPSSNVTNAGSEAKAEASHGKASGDASESCPLQSVGPQGGMHQRNDVDYDRWRQGTAFQKGLAPYPQTPMPMMHKAEKKYEVGKVSNEKEAKQRQLKAILNKLTPQNFGKLGKQVKQMNIDNVTTLSGLISQIFDRALMEPTFCEMYANFCYQLSIDLPPLSVDNKSISFKRLLLNKCQELFEREEREEEEANKAEVEGEVKQSAEEREEKRLCARRCLLGSIRLIGELYKKNILAERIMHHCINKMLGQYQNPDEEKIDALCKLMSTIGEMIDNPNAKEHMDAYFDVMAQLSNNMKLSSRLTFMLKDAIDLRKNKWQQRRKVEGLITIEVPIEVAKQRQLNAILNKLTPHNFVKMFLKVKQLNINNIITMSEAVSQIFDKALMKPTLCDMYANFCYQLDAVLPELSVDNKKITFKRLLLNKCQEEFERREREEEEANKAEEEGEFKQSAEEREERRLRARRRMLGNIRLIGELYKKRMFPEKLMHHCINKLLGQHQNPDEGNIEALCELMSTIGEMIDRPKAKDLIDAYYDMMGQLSNNMQLSSKLRFMLKDAIDLRKNKWQQRRKVGLITIEVPIEVAKQRQLKAILNKLTPQNFEKLFEQVKQVNIDNVITLSGAVSQIFDKALMKPTFCEIYANFCYHLAVDLPDLSVDNEKITFKRLLLNKCQEEFERGEREEEEANKAEEEGEVKQSAEEREEKRLRARRRMLGNIRLIGELYKKRMLTERIMHECINKLLGQYQNPDEENIEALCELMSTIGEMIDHPRAKEHMDYYFAVMAQLSNNMQLSSRVKFMLKDAIDLRKNKWQQGRRVEGPKKIEEVHRDASDGALPTSPSPRGGPPSVTHNVSSDKVWPEEQLRDKSLAAIKEFYSVRDEKEVALCIKDLNAPSFYPSMISIWVTDSFERKDMERDVLTKLLINLSKPQDRTISEDQLVKGFESVLEVLEDAVNDAPRAAEFLGRMFAKIILENVVSLSYIGKLVHEGGEEKGRLVEVGIAAEVLGSIFDIIESEKGESVLNEIRSSSNLRVEDFRPVGSSKKSRIDKYSTT